MFACQLYPLFVLFHHNSPNTPDSVGLSAPRQPRGETGIPYARAGNILLTNRLVLQPRGAGMAITFTLLLRPATIPFLSFVAFVFFVVNLFFFAHSAATSGGGAITLPAIPASICCDAITLPCLRCLLFKILPLIRVHSRKFAVKISSSSRPIFTVFCYTFIYVFPMFYMTFFIFYYTLSNFYLIVTS